ncbi:methionyl-tRNA formyltransferase [Halorientalis pallida]|uniref:methionyl-tRNA formyltransferase n=1 Tax=Halorientalis pallida TaxID=2479928 RepID=UPI003C6EC997
MTEAGQDATVGVAGTKIYTQDCLDTLLRAGRGIDYLVTLTPSQASEYGVAGYQDLRPFAETHDIQVYHPEEYGLGTATDRDAIKGMDLDVLLVTGWSRLVPEPILESVSAGAIGAHGSPDGLPKGRGRAVLNWALIEGETEFEIATFFLEPGVDDGNVIDTTTFSVTEFDTASTLRYKTWMVYTDTVLEHFDDIVRDEVATTPQPASGATYYPKRRPEDGAIDWSKSAVWLHAFVRALTDPYPGAFTHLDGDRVTIWDAQPFDDRLDFSSGTPGRVVKVFCDGEILVETGDSALLVTDFEGVSPSAIEPGSVFRSVPHEETLGEIRTRYPDFVEDNQKEI